MAQFKVSGKILEFGSGETLPNATVVIEGTSTGTTSNLDGFFTLLDLPSNDLKLVVSYIGFETQVISLRDHKIDELLIISLKPLSAELNEVVVVADAYKTLNTSHGVSTATISTKQLALLPNVGETDIFRSLQLLPGVSATNENSSGLFVRGGTPDQNLVLLDGVTIYKVDHFFGFFSAFNTNAIKDVQLHKGAFPAKYGARTSGVIDLTGKLGSFQQFGGGFNVNLLSFNGWAEIPLSEKFSFFIAGRRSYTDILRSGIFNNITENLMIGGGFDNPDVNPINETVVRPDFYFYDVNSKLSFRPNDKDLITFSFYNGQDFLDESRQLNIPFSNGVIENGLFFVDVAETTDYGNTGGSLKWSRQWSPKLYSSYLVAGSKYFSEFNRNGFLEISNVEADSVVLSGSQLTFEDNSVIDLSARADFEWQHHNNAKTSFGFSYTKTIIDYSNVRNDTTVILNRDQEAQFGSLYVSEERKIGNRLNINTGLRLSKYEFEDKILIEPRISANYQLTDKFKLKAAYGTHYQFVNRIINENISEGSREFWLLADGDLVEVSKAIHYVFGASYELNNWLFDLEGYYKDITGLSEFSLRFRQGININAEELFFTGDGIAQGIEFLVQKKQGLYTGWASYTLGKVRNTFEAFNNGTPFPALHDQLHEFKMVHSYEIDQWVLAATFVYGSGKPFSEPAGQYNITLIDGSQSNFISIGDKNGSRLPAYHRLDLSAHYKFDWGKHKADLGFSVFNFYGRQNVWYVEYDFNQDPVLVSEINYLGFTPNISFSMNF